jgi:hypothetical protein
MTPPRLVRSERDAAQGLKARSGDGPPALSAADRRKLICSASWSRLGGVRPAAHLPMNIFVRWPAILRTSFNDAAVWLSHEI